MWKWIVVVLAAAGAVAGVVLAMRGMQTPPVPPPLHDPVRNPYADAIAGAGLVEPESENVVVGAPESGLVTKLSVTRGSVVRKGDPLFQIDTRSLDSERVAADAQVRLAEAELARVRAYRRPEEEPLLRATASELNAAAAQARQAVAEAEAMASDADWAMKDADAKLARASALVASGSISAQEHDDARFAAERAKARLAAATAGIGASQAAQAVAEARAARAKADVDLFHAGAWGPDVARAEAAVAEARARAERIALDIERRIVRSPIAGTVLRCSLHEGEFVAAASAQADQAALVIGDLAHLRVRVDVDEFDAFRFRPGAAATAFLKGRADPAIALTFVAVEPFVAPKRALTNSQREFVDTRVLQVIFALGGAHPLVHPGQQLDVFIDAQVPPEQGR